GVIPVGDDGRRAQPLLHAHRGVLDQCGGAGAGRVERGGDGRHDDAQLLADAGAEQHLEVRGRRLGEHGVDRVLVDAAVLDRITDRLYGEALCRPPWQLAVARVAHADDAVLVANAHGAVRSQRRHDVRTYGDRYRAGWHQDIP